MTERRVFGLFNLLHILYYIKFILCVFKVFLLYFNKNIMNNTNNNNNSMSFWFSLGISIKTSSILQLGYFLHISRGFAVYTSFKYCTKQK